MMNNLDSCDLEDDDLMLDAEDVSLDSDGDRTSNMAQWRMRQLCWGTQDVHTDHESDLQCYKLTEDPGNKRTDGDFVLDLCPSRTPCLPPALGLDVEELADDCSAVRSQLEHLQRLLLQEDDVDEDTLTTDTLSPEAEDSSHSSDSQVQALLQEVQQLREDLRSRDRTIAQLTLQLTFPTVTARCRGQETTGRMDRHTQMSVTERESVASQTPWTEHKSQIFHSSGRENQEPLTDRVPPPPPLAQAPPPAQAPPSARPCPEIPAVSLPDDMTEEREDDGKRPTKEKRGAHCRSLKLPQPSKLRLFLSQTSAAARPPQTRASRQPSTPHDPESEGSSVLKPALDTSGLSRLPKPKSH